MLKVHNYDTFLLVACVGGEMDGWREREGGEN